MRSSTPTSLTTSSDRSNQKRGPLYSLRRLILRRGQRPSFFIVWIEIGLKSVRSPWGGYDAAAGTGAHTLQTDGK